MSVSVKEITAQALTLPATEREKLAFSLLQSTHNSELTEIDQEWISLAEERFADLHSGKDSGIPESEFFGKVKENIQWKYLRIWRSGGSLRICELLRRRS